jgi:hypothetical protein
MILDSLKGFPAAAGRRDARGGIPPQEDPVCHLLGAHRKAYEGAQTGPARFSPGWVGQEVSPTILTRRSFIAGQGRNASYLTPPARRLCLVFDFTNIIMYFWKKNLKLAPFGTGSLFSFLFIPVFNGQI